MNGVDMFDLATGNLVDTWTSVAEAKAGLRDYVEQNPSFTPDELFVDTALFFYDAGVQTASLVDVDDIMDFLQERPDEA